MDKKFLNCLMMKNKWFNELKKKWTLITKAGRDKRYDLLYDAKVLNRYFRNMDASPLAKRNSLQLFTDGQEKFQALFEDIRAAKETVHVEYYAFFNDTIGNQFLDVLIEKLHEGVEVYLIYDPWGSPGANKKFLLVTLTLEEK